MAKYTSADYGALLIGPYDITGVTDKLEVTIEDPIVDTTPFGASSAQLSKPGLKKYSITGHDGWYDDAATSIAAEAVAGLALTSTQQGLIFADRGIADGARCLMTQGAIVGGFTRQFNVGEMTKANLDLAVTGAAYEGQLAFGYTTSTGATFNSETPDIQWNGLVPSTMNGGWMFLSVPVITWGATATTLDIAFEHSVTPDTYVTHTSFTQITKAGYASGLYSEIKLIAGQVNRYIAVKGTFSAAGATATMAVGVYLNP